MKRRPGGQVEVVHHLHVRPLDEQELLHISPAGHPRGVSPRRHVREEDGARRRSSRRARGAAVSNADAPTTIDGDEHGICGAGPQLGGYASTRGGPARGDGGAALR